MSHIVYFNSAPLCFKEMGLNFQHPNREHTRTLWPICGHFVVNHDLSAELPPDTDVREFERDVIQCWPARDGKHKQEQLRGRCHGRSGGQPGQH